VLFPVERIAEICQSRGVLYHCDAVQAAGKVEIDVRKIPADYFIRAHRRKIPRTGRAQVRRAAAEQAQLCGSPSRAKTQSCTLRRPTAFRCCVPYAGAALDRVSSRSAFTLVSVSVPHITWPLKRRPIRLEQKPNTQRASSNLYSRARTPAWVGCVN
jgi:hypothetical protein